MVSFRLGVHGTFVYRPDDDGIGRTDRETDPVGGDERWCGESGENLKRKVK